MIAVLSLNVVDLLMMSGENLTLINWGVLTLFNLERKTRKYYFS